MKCAAIVLAAGASSRMGQPKQSLDVGGHKLLTRTVETIVAAKLSRVAVILGSHASMHRGLVEHLPVDMVINPAWEKGMGSSIKAGLTHLIGKDSQLEGIIISVCDQPLLTTININELITRHLETDKPIIASEYAGSVGVPALFHKRFFEHLLQLSDDEGAKKIIHQHLRDVSLVPFPEGATDLDTMKDYEAFLNREGTT